MTGANGEVSFINIKTLNEWDSRVRRGHLVAAAACQPPVAFPFAALGKLPRFFIFCVFPPLGPSLRKRWCARG